MPTLFILCGIPACGKSYFAKYMFDNYNVIHISRDSIRFEIVKEDEPYFSHEDEVFKTFVSEIIFHLSGKCDVIADATHLNKTSRKKLIRAIDKYNIQYNIIYVYFSTSLETCCKRNSARSGRARVPDSVIREMWNKLEKPTIEEDNRCIGIMEMKGEK